MEKHSTCLKLVFLAFFLLTVSAPTLAILQTTNEAKMGELTKEVAEEMAMEKLKALQVLMEMRSSSNNINPKFNQQDYLFKETMSLSCGGGGSFCNIFNPSVCCSGTCIPFSIWGGICT